MKFSVWDDAIHEMPDQKKRLESAKKKETTPTSIDSEAQTAAFPSSGNRPYSTRLDQCSCVDFSKRKLPCKHIYRLAIELGLISEIAESGVNKNIANASQISVEDAVAEIENLSDSSQVEIKNFLYLDLYGNTHEYSILSSQENSDLSRCSLLENVCNSVSMLNFFKRNEIVKILADCGLTGFKKNMSKNSLIDWVIKNISDPASIFPKVQTFKFSDRFSKARRSLYSYLLRKYDWDEYFDGDKIVRYPHGAEYSCNITLSVDYGAAHSTVNSESGYSFPDDKITKLLNLYGHNRCINGFSVPQEDSK